MPRRPQTPDAILRAAERLPKARAEADRMGLPRNAEGFRVRPPVPPAANAASIYRELAAVAEGEMKRIGANPPEWTGYVGPKRTDADRRAARKAVEGAKDVLRLARRAAERPRCDFERAWKPEGQSFPEYGPMLYATDLLTVEARLQAEDGDPLAAVETVRVAGIVARHLEEPHTVCFAARYLALGVIHNAYVDLLDWYGGHAGFLTAAEKNERVFDGLTDYTAFLRGQVWSQVSPIAAIRAGKTTLREQRGGPDGKTLPPNFPPDPPEAERVAYADAWECRCLEFFVEAYGAFGKTGATARTQLADAAGLLRDCAERYRAGDPSYQVIVLYGPQAIAGFPRAMRAAAEIRLRRVTFAAIREHGKTGRFPGELPLPLNDPFNDRLLKYRAEKDSFTAYSVGANLRDDGGATDIEPGDGLRFPKDIVMAFKFRRNPA